MVLRIVCKDFDIRIGYSFCCLLRKRGGYKRVQTRPHVDKGLTRKREDQWTRSYIPITVLKSLLCPYITSGTHGDLRTVVVSRLETGKLETVEPALVPVLDAVIELEKLLGFDKLDIEFAVDDEDIVHVFQVRPITVDHSNYEVDLESIELSLNESIKRYMSSQSHQPFSYGTKTLFSNMSDWNPAEDSPR